ncbi:hypothetical protein STENM36S_04375 [Streptomyces tendae]
MPITPTPTRWCPGGVSRNHVLDVLPGLDLLVLGGGGILYDGEARRYLRLVRAAQTRHVPTFAYAVGAGPLTDAEDRDAVRTVLAEMDDVVVRDEESRLVLEEVGLEREVAVTADPALLLAPEPFTEAMMRDEGIPSGARLVGHGRPEDGLVQPMTLMFRVADFARPDFAAYVREHPDQWRGVHGLWDLIEEARAGGELRLPREDILFFATPHPHEVAVNSTRVNRVLGTSVWDLSRAEYTARRQLAEIDRFLRTRVPGFEESYVVQSGTHIGVRESRRVLGDYQLTGHDILAARTFPDVIAHGAYPVDIHNPRGSGTVLKRVPRGSFYDIPLRCLLPRGTDRLLVAGRCISGTHVAHSSYRVMPIAMATGHAAGVCAALTVRHGRGPRGLPYRLVQRELLRQGARLRTGPE